MGSTTVGADMRVELIFQRYSESRVIAWASKKKKKKANKEMGFHAYATPKQHVVDVVPEEVEDHHLHHRGPTLISMDIFTGLPQQSMLSTLFISKQRQMVMKSWY